MRFLGEVADCREEFWCENVLEEKKERGNRLGRSVECQSIGSMVCVFFGNTRDVMVFT